MGFPVQLDIVVNKKAVHWHLLSKCVPKSILHILCKLSPGPEDCWLWPLDSDLHASLCFSDKYSCGWRRDK